MYIFSVFQTPLDGEILKPDPEIPLKKTKMEDFFPYNMPQFHQIIAMDPIYVQYLHEWSTAPNRHLSAFKPVPHALKETKLRHGHAIGRYADPPVLQNPERVIPLSESERFERTFQPNVALAPPTPKKLRYASKSEEPKDNEVSSSLVKDENHHESVIKSEVCNGEAKRSPESQSAIDSTVSVVQSTANLTRYNSEIELSTDTDDSASETSEKHPDCTKIEEALKDVDADVKIRVLEHVRQLAKDRDNLSVECRNKDNKIAELEARIADLERKVGSHCSQMTNGHGDAPSPVLDDGGAEEEVKENCSSIIVRNKENGDVDGDVQKTVVIASIERKAIVVNASE